MQLPTIEIDAKDIETCRLAVWALYETIETFHGEKEARRLFARYGRDLTGTFIRERKNARLVMEYLTMSEPDPQKLAEELAKKNESLPQEKRYGPRGSINVETMRKQIKRALKNKKYCEAADLSLTTMMRAALPYPK
jgi:hypothetical protein